MELRDFFALFGIHKKIFWNIVIVSVIIGALFYFVQPQKYKSSLALNVTRDGVQSVDEYTYDNFYRLQADERFADTVVQWINSPHILVKVLDGNIGKKIDAKRLSSQVVEVVYVTDTPKEGAEIAKSLIVALNDEAQRLNQKQNQDNWFVILGSDPVITDNTYSLLFLCGVSGALGFFIAFWSVMIVHYFTNDHTK